MLRKKNLFSNNIMLLQPVGELPIYEKKFTLLHLLLAPLSESVC